MNKKIPGCGIFFSPLITALWIAFILTHCQVAFSQETGKQATIAVLSHTDFLPDATGVYDRRSWHGRDKNPDFAADNDLPTGSDQAYDNVKRGPGYDPESVGLPEILADAILEQLAKGKRFIPVERKALRTSLIEQRFGKAITSSYLDRSLDKVIEDMDSFEIGAGIAADSILKGAKFNNLLRDFKDLGSAIGAQYLVIGNLHLLGSGTEEQKVPFSDSNRKVRINVAEARIRLRVVDAQKSTVVGADSLHVKISTAILAGQPLQTDDFSFLEQVGKTAARKILDLTFPGKIVSIQPLVISRGENDGVTNGDLFNIVREGKEIREQSGIVIARLKQPVGNVRVVDAQETVSVVEPDKGSGFTEGDLAVIAEKEGPSAAEKTTVPVRNSNNPGRELPRVAVGLVKVGSTAKTGEDAGKHVPTFTDTIISRLVQTKRFTVVDRQEVDQLLDEQIAQAFAENREMQSIMGKLKGCDYLLIGSLQNFSMEEQTLQLPNSSKIIEILEGFSEGNMRLVDARSGDILDSRKISITAQLERDIGEDRLIASLADKYAAEVVAVLLNSVYPIKVAAIAPDGAVYVNRGSDGLLKQEDMFDVMRPGQIIRDPDTGVELGSMESKVGQLRLTRVEEARSIGKMVANGLAQSGDILRRSSSAKKKTGTNLSGEAEKFSQQTAPGKYRTKPTLVVTKTLVNENQKAAENSSIYTLQQNTLDLLADELINSLSKTHRFTIMERSDIDELLDEKTFNAIAQGENIRDYLKELEGSDYVVISKLSRFVLKIEKKKVPYLDEVTTNVTGTAEGTMRIVDSHTSRIVATDEVRIKRKYNKSELADAHYRLVDLYATQAAAGIVDSLYPKRILAVMPDGTIFINRGEDVGIKAGSTFSVERPGEDLIDPDTGLSSGPAEMTIGTLRITSVEQSRSRAQMVSGKEPVEGDILRNERPPEKPKPPKKKPVNW